MTTDVFVRTTSRDRPLRAEMRELCMARWRLEPARVLDIVDWGISEGREYAEREAQTDPYIFCDDDVVIMGRNWVERATGILLRNTEYGAVSTLSMIEGENQAIAPDDGVEIYPMHAVGAPMLIRKGLMTNLPEMDLNSECGVIHKYLLDLGYKEGLVWGGPGNRLRHMHLGNSFSSNPILHWGY